MQAIIFKYCSPIVDLLQNSAFSPKHSWSLLFLTYNPLQPRHTGRSSVMVFRHYNASARPWRVGHWHHNIFVSVLFAANVVATLVINEVGCSTCATAATADHEWSMQQATCLPDALSQTHGKLVGAQGQDPCYLAGSVLAQCGEAHRLLTPQRERFVLTILSPGDGIWTLLPLNQVPGLYPIPGGNGGVEPTECSCSRVAYNLLSACAACQTTSGTAWVGYALWSFPCTAANISRQVQSMPMDKG